MFNGRDLTGWKGLAAVQGGPPARAKMAADELKQAEKEDDQRIRAHWRRKDGVLVFDGKGENIATDQDYGDFELLLDWKIEHKGDSGVYVRGTPQVQIWDPDEPSYERLGAKHGSGGLWNNQKHPKHPTTRADKPLGQWNHFRIVMRGDKVTVYLNDTLVVDNVTLENYWEPGKPLYATGPKSSCRITAIRCTSKIFI